MKKVHSFIYILIITLTVICCTPRISSALLYPFNLTLSGASENPPNLSTGTGNITGTYDDVTNVMAFNITFSGLSGITTASHFHAPAGVTNNAPVMIGNAGFPTGVTSGSYGNSYVLTAQQETWLLTDSVYLNIHTNVFPAGEIRCQMSLDNPLPVELSSFTSVINANNVILNWSTTSETNNSGFEIERSLSNTDWTKIGFITGSGTVSTPVNYSFTDRNLTTGIFSYRLKQIDFNGNFEYFNLTNDVNIGVPAEFELSQNYPNPFNPTTNIDFAVSGISPPRRIVSLKIYDISGKEVATLVNEQKVPGYYSISFNGANLSSGIYFYTLSAVNFTETKRMILLK